MKPGVSLAVTKTAGVILLSTLLIFTCNIQAEGHDYYDEDCFTVLPQKGIKVYQIDFRFSGVKVKNSDWGRISVDPGNLCIKTKESSGYLNVFTDEGWIVQNLPLELKKDAKLISKYFSLGLGEPKDVNTLSAYVEFSTEPQFKFMDGPRSDFPVECAVWNAEGAGQDPTTEVGAAPLGNLEFKHKFPGKMHKQENQNVQAAVNQCVTMAMANSLQYLEERFGLPVPNDHQPGLRGDNTLVGRLDTATDRPATSRTVGSGLWFIPWLEGKFSYLAANGLDEMLIQKHQGRGWGGPGNEIPDGNFESSGITSRDKGENVTWKWICHEVKKGEDVEIAFSYDDGSGNPTGGHAVRVFGCGHTFGVPWIMYLHDSWQSNDDEGLEQVFAWAIDTDNDGMINLDLALDREIRFAHSESVIHKFKNH